MPLDLPAGSACFLDSNILYYCWTETPPLSAPCRDLLARIDAGEVRAFTTVQVLSDAIHKTMFAEVALRFAQGRGGMIVWIKKRPEVLSALQGIKEVANQLTATKASIVEITPVHLREAVGISAEARLLMNDALTLP